MAWILLIVAGLLEVVWAYYMKQSQGFTQLGPSIITIIAMIGSFILLSIAMRSLPLSSSYTIWTGIGALGTFIIGLVALGETVSLTRILAAVLILTGIILLKFSSDH